MSLQGRHAFNLIFLSDSHFRNGIEGLPDWLLCFKNLNLVNTFITLQVKWSGVRTQHSTTPFVDEMYDRLREMLNDYEIIICRWPEYIFVLENVCQHDYLLLLIHLNEVADIDYTCSNIFLLFFNLSRHVPVHEFIFFLKRF